MFALTKIDIESASLREHCLANEAGGYVCFEGWVRNRNEGREVCHLEFEAANALANNEFAKIESEAREQFDILELVCVHRVGVVPLGELAVWIGVTARHRDPAFTACRYVIDELKQRLPIWKKEHYRDGDSGWINHP